MEPRTINNQQQPLKCVNQLSNSFAWLSLLLLPGEHSWLALRMKYVYVMIAPALRVAVAGLHALILASTANLRIYVGLVLMGVVAPLAACVYLLFDRGIVVKGWYHLNYFHLFFLLGPHLFEFFCLLGAFLLFPKDSKRAYFLIIPAGYVLAKILWLITVTNNAEFWSVIPSSFILIGMLISTVLFVLTDWLTWRKFHGEDSFEKREKGLYQIANDVPAEKFRSMVMETWANKFNFHSKY